MGSSNKNKKKNQYFVILWQQELEMFDTSAQLGVYQAIKSFSANGKKEVALSLREIAERSCSSHTWTKEIIKQLIDKKMLAIVGKEGRRGGLVNVYQVLTRLTVKSSKCEPSKHLEKSSVNSLASSVNCSGTKSQQSNKVNNKNTNKKENLSLVGSKKTTPPSPFADLVNNPTKRAELWKILDKASAEEISRKGGGQE